MKWTALLLVLLLSSCSFWSSKETKFISRSVSNTDFYNMSASERLSELESHIAETLQNMNPKGNPRYHVFEIFQKRVASHVVQIRKHENELGGKEFIPSNLEVVEQFRNLIAGHKIMNEAGIYIVSSKIVEPDTQETVDSLFALKQVMMMYEDEVRKKGGPIWKPELTENAESFERLQMIQALSHKIEDNYDSFAPIASKQKLVQSYLKKWQQVKFSNRDQIKSEYKKIRAYGSARSVPKMLSNLDLPESGEVAGTDESFEVVMSVQFSNELIEFLSQKELRI